MKKFKFKKGLELLEQSSQNKWKEVYNEYGISKNLAKIYFNLDIDKHNFLDYNKLHLIKFTFLDVK